MKLDATPWAREQMSDEVRAVIAVAEPKHIVVVIGRSSGGWTCRLLDGNRVVGEAYHADTPTRAYSAALFDMEAKAVA